MRSHFAAGVAIRDSEVDAELFDLKQKIGAMVDTFNWPMDNCAGGTPNPVVSVTSKSLTAQSDLSRAGADSSVQVRP
jgi:hypothetical protein